MDAILYSAQTDLPLGALAVPASTHENQSSELMLGHLDRKTRLGQMIGKLRRDGA